MPGECEATNGNVAAGLRHLLSCHLLTVICFMSIGLNGTFTQTVTLVDDVHVGVTGPLSSMLDVGCYWVDSYCYNCLLLLSRVSVLLRQQTVVTVCLCYYAGILLLQCVSVTTLCVLLLQCVCVTTPADCCCSVSVLLCFVWCCNSVSVLLC